MWSQCETRQEQRTGKIQEHPQSELILTHVSPMESINVDYAQFGNGYYLVAANRCSGMIFAKKVDSQTTSEALKYLIQIWNVHGVSHSDSGPAFCQHFKDSLEEIGVDLHHSSPYHPQGNGLAER